MRLSIVDLTGGGLGIARTWGITRKICQLNGTLYFCRIDRCTVIKLHESWVNTSSKRCDLFCEMQKGGLLWKVTTSHAWRTEFSFLSVDNVVDITKVLRELGLKILTSTPRALISSSQSFTHYIASRSYKCATRISLILTPIIQYLILWSHPTASWLCGYRQACCSYGC